MFTIDQLAAWQVLDSPRPASPIGLTQPSPWPRY